MNRSDNIAPVDQPERGQAAGDHDRGAEGTVYQVCGLRQGVPSYG